jgi:hypothetical protein
MLRIGWGRETTIRAKGERKDKLLVQLEQQREREERREAEQKARENRLLTQLEQLMQKLTDK